MPKITDNLISIYFKTILFDTKSKSFIVKNGFIKKTIPINTISDIGICYGGITYGRESIHFGKKVSGGLEKYFSGKYEIEEIPPISIYIKSHNKKIPFYIPLTVSTTKKGRTLYLVEQIFDKMESFLEVEDNV